MRIKFAADRLCGKVEIEEKEPGRLALVSVLLVFQPVQAVKVSVNEAPSALIPPHSAK